MVNKEDEPFPQEIYRRGNKQFQSYAAYFWFEKEIETKVITRQNAISVGCMLLTYGAEWHLHAEARAVNFRDEVMPNLDLDDAFRDFLNKLFADRVGHDYRMRLEQAIAGAQTGDYREVKLILKEQKEAAKLHSRHTPLSRNLGLLVKFIPNFGEPFKLPAPAVFDPRFNPEASPLPSYLVQTQD